MTEHSDPPADRATGLIEASIEFKGRTIYVKPPQPEQIVVWQRTVRSLQDANAGDWNGAQIIAALERGVKIINSLFANATDIEWLDDQMLLGKIKFPDAAEIIQLAVEAFVSQQVSENREERRAAIKPAKKAARKRAASEKGK